MTLAGLARHEVKDTRSGAIVQQQQQQQQRQLFQTVLPSIKPQKILSLRYPCQRMLRSLRSTPEEVCRIRFGHGNRFKSL